jgi:hypothetical protein
MCLVHVEADCCCLRPRMSTGQVTPVQVADKVQAHSSAITERTQRLQHDLHGSAAGATIVADAACDHDVPNPEVPEAEASAPAPAPKRRDAAAIVNLVAGGPAASGMHTARAHAAQKQASAPQAAQATEEDAPHTGRFAGRALRSARRSEPAQERGPAPTMANARQGVHKPGRQGIQAQPTTRLGSHRVEMQAVAIPSARKQQAVYRVASGARVRHVPICSLTCT